MARQTGQGARRWVTSPAYDAVVQTVVAARHAAGLSQAALAEKVSKPPSYIAKIELKERRLDPVEWIELLQALGASERAALDCVMVALGEQSELS